MNKFFQKIIEFRWSVILSFAFISLFGIYSLSRVKIDAIPDITNKQVIINTKTFAMDPSKIEKAVTYPIESEFYGIDGLVEMRSISKFGLSQIILIFDDEVDIHFARSQILQRISSTRDKIPSNISPTIAPLTTGIGEIIMYRLYDPSGKADLMNLRAIQEYKIARELKKVRGVAEIDTIGGFERELHLNVFPKQLAKYGMTPQKIINQIQTIGENFGGGYIEEGGQQKLVRTFAGFKNFEDVMSVPIKIDYSGKILPLKHIVEVASEHSQRLGAATYAGKEAVIGTVMMQQGANAKEVLVMVKQAIDRLNQRESGVKIEILYDRQFLIDSTIKTVLRNLLEGILLVVVVLCLLLGSLKIGIIVASSLLFCILILAACMNVFNISANLMSLGAIDFGLLVDSSVVLVEYLVANLLISRSKEEKINSIAKFSAAVTRPIIFGIAIIALVYVPILLFSGIEGKTFKPMAINVIIAMIASLGVALFLMPVLSYFFIKPSIHKHQEHKVFIAIKNKYRKILHLALNNFKTTILCCITLFVASLGLLIALPSDFLPKLSEGDIVYTVVAKNGTSLSNTVEIVKDFEQKVSSHKEVKKTFSRIGVSQSGLDLMPQNSADLFVILNENSKVDAREISKKIYDEYKDLVEYEIIPSQPIEMKFNEMLEGSRADLSLKIFGDDLEQLILITQKIKSLLKTQPQIKEMEEDFINSIKKGLFIDVAPNYEQIVKNQVTISDVNNELKDSMAGIQVGNFYASEFPVSIVMHLSERNRNSAGAIGKIPVSLSDGGSFPLERVAKIQENEGIISISRLFGKRYSSLSIYLKDTNYDSFISSAQIEIKNNKILPNGYYIEWGGRFENLINAKKQIIIIIPIIIAIIFFMLYKVFGNLKMVFVVFSVVPFALSGAILLLFLCHIPITISVYVGFIALIGISLLNSIILIDTINHAGNHRESIEESCLSRLRPILMTAIVASLGFLPMAFGHGIGAEVQQPIAITVIGGIISSTVATLILSPVLLSRIGRENKPT